jgi:hypothetical protein
MQRQNKNCRPPALTSQSSPDYYEVMPDLVTEALTPEEINLFLLLHLKNEDSYRHANCLGYFTARLIQNSYNAGHNDFRFVPASLPRLNNLCYDIAGTEERLLKVDITGDGGGSLACYAKHVELNVEGRAGENFAYWAEGSVFTVGSLLHPPSSTTDAKRCTFRTADMQTLKDFLKYAPRGNRVVYIKPDGEDRIVRDYEDVVTCRPLFK